MADLMSLGDYPDIYSLLFVCFMNLGHCGG